MWHICPSVGKLMSMWSLNSERRQWLLPYTGLARQPAALPTAKEPYLRERQRQSPGLWTDRQICLEKGETVFKRKGNLEWDHDFKRLGTDVSHSRSQVKAATCDLGWLHHSITDHQIQFSMIKLKTQRESAWLRGRFPRSSPLSCHPLCCSWVIREVEKSQNLLWSWPYQVNAGTLFAVEN